MHIYYIIIIIYYVYYQTVSFYVFINIISQKTTLTPHITLAAADAFSSQFAPRPLRRPLPLLHEQQHKSRFTN